MAFGPGTALSTCGMRLQKVLFKTLALSQTTVSCNIAHVKANFLALFFILFFITAAIPYVLKALVVF